MPGQRAAGWRPWRALTAVLGPARRRRRGAPARSAMAFPDDIDLGRLYEERQTLERRVDELRRLRDGADPEQYEQELERLLVELALKSREIRQKEASMKDSEVR